MATPYETLGVAQTATLDEIKKAYRKLARKHHPDINPGNKEAEKKFKEISHAFDLIGTEEARAKYDRGETEEQQREQYQRYYRDTQGPHSRYSQTFGEDVDMDDILSQIFGSAGGRRRQQARSQELYQMEVGLHEAVAGGEKVITLPSGKTLQVKIPAGIEEGKKLKFKGMGMDGGDVYVQIIIRPDPRFRAEGKDLHTEVEISMFEAALGGEISIPTVDGSVLMKVPAGVSTGSKLRVKGKGLGHGAERGNLIVALKVVTPKHVDPGLKEGLEELARKYSYNPRGHA